MSSSSGSESAATWQVPSLQLEGVHSAGPTLGLTKPRAPSAAQISLLLGSKQEPEQWEDQVVAFAVTEEAAQLVNGRFTDVHLAKLDELLGVVLSELAEDEGFKGQIEQAASVRLGSGKVRRVLLVGLGKAASLGSDAAVAQWSAFGEATATACLKFQAASLTVGPVGSLQLSEQQQLKALHAVATSFLLKSCRDERFKSKEADEVKLRSITFANLGNSQAVLREACSLCRGVVIARQLTVAPANVVTPGALANAAVAIAAEYKDVMSADILEKEQCEALGMGSYLAVTAASDLPPKFIHLKYTPKDPPIKRRLAIIGKGLTHDTGGYNIKVGCGIETMKADMGGAAAVLGAAEVIGALRPPGVEVHFISAACENMISGRGYRPGDVITASNGKTIEVTNTDAEGRLTLADALTYACRLKVDTVVDLATLTGAVVTALGDDIAGLFSPSDSLAADLEAAGKRAGEKLWRLPMEESYKAMLKSPIADLRNSDLKRTAGSIKAALFLREFVEEGVEWAHLDIAGPAFVNGVASGYGVATLVTWVKAVGAL